MSKQRTTAPPGLTMYGVRLVDGSVSRFARPVLAYEDDDGAFAYLVIDGGWPVMVPDRDLSPSYDLTVGYTGDTLVVAIAFEAPTEQVWAEAVSELSHCESYNRNLRADDIAADRLQQDTGDQ